MAAAMLINANAQIGWMDLSVYEKKTHPKLFDYNNNSTFSSQMVFLLHFGGNGVCRFLHLNSSYHTHTHTHTHTLRDI